MTSLQLSSHDEAKRSVTSPHMSQNRLERGYSSSLANTRSPYPTGESTATESGSTTGKPVDSSPLSQAAIQQYGRFNEEWDASQRGSSIADGPSLQRSTSATSQGEMPVPSRGGTLKKKPSLRRGNS